MASIVINNGTVRYNKTIFDQRTSGSFNRVQIAGDLTKTLAKQLNAEKVYASDGEWETAKLQGELRLLRVEITPKDGLEKHALAFEALEAREFKLKHGSGGTTTIHCQVVTDKPVAGLINDYLNTVGYGPAKIVLLPPKGEQLTLDTESE